MKAFLKSTIIIVAITALLFAASFLAAPARETRAFLERLAAGSDAPQGRNFLEAVPVAADPGEVGELGAAVAVYGDTAVIGAPQADGSKGAVFVFERVDGQWIRQQKLVPADRSGVLQFGLAVDLHGDIAIIGATGGRNDSSPGSAFVFTRSGGSWSETHRLAAYDGAPGDGYGTSVALDEGRAIVGAAFAKIGSDTAQGAAYLYNYYDGAWHLRKKIIANDGKASDNFGASVDLDGNTAVVGAHSADIAGEQDQGAVYVITHDLAWSQQRKLVAFDGAGGDRFGAALALDGGTILVGAWNKHVAPNPGQGAAYIFTGSGSTWNLQQKLTVSDGQEEDRFGISVALNGDTALVGATGWDFISFLTTEEDRGTAYVFTRSADLWRRGQDLVAHDGQQDDLFGGAVALDRDTAVIGAIRAIDSDIGQTGKFYATERGPQPWLLQDRVRDSDTSGCSGFGYAVGLDGSTAVVSRSTEYGDDGTVYFYELIGGAWKEQKRFNIDGGAASIALQGDTAVIGAPNADAGPNKPNYGAAYVFVFEGGAWKQQQKLAAGDSDDYDGFGIAVALDAGTIMVGSSGNANRGAVYVFTPGGGGKWNLGQKLVAADGKKWGYFGVAVDLDGDTAIVGAPGDFGAAYIFTRSGSAWTEQQKLVAGDAEDFGQFGGSVALDGQTAVIGASNQEAAYIFTWNGSEWQEQQKLVAADNPGYSSMGKSVDLDGDTAVIGAVRADIGSTMSRGAAYVYKRGDSDWQQTQKLIPPDGPQRSVFGYPALDEDTVLVGAPGDNYWCSGARRFAYFFEGGKLVQFITFPTPSGGEIGDVVPLTAVASSSLPVAYESRSPRVCSVSEGAALLKTNGTCRIRASQLGDETYNPAQDVAVAFAVGEGAYRHFLPAVNAPR